MPKYWVDAKLEIRGRLEIEADNLEQAKERADELFDSDVDIDPDTLRWSDQEQEWTNVREVKYVAPKTEAD